MRISELVEKAHVNARAKGFWDDRLELIGEMEWKEVAGGDYFLKVDTVAKVMLIVTELSEGVEAMRRGDPEGLREEIADVFIRLGDLCGGLKIDIEKEITSKMMINRDRPRKHGKGF